VEDAKATERYVKQSILKVNAYETMVTSNLQHVENINEEHINVEDLNKQIIHTIQEARKESCSKIRKRQEKLSTNTLNMMKYRREVLDKYTTNYTSLRQLNKDISKAIRKDIRTYNTLQLEKRIE
ncbi:hypothetical protein HUJ04_011090, partial [Dendroctonus ponderosae]